MITPNPTSKIELSAGSTSLILRRLTGEDYPRQRLQVTGVTFSPYGTPATDGTSYVPEFIWNMVALLLPEEVNKLDRLEVLSLTQNLLLVDRTDRVWEPVQTRAIAPEDVAIVSEGMVGYYAQFYARITQPIKYSKNGAYRQAQIQLTETAKVSIA
jgi:hypothetical protein